MTLQDVQRRFAVLSLQTEWREPSVASALEERTHVRPSLEVCTHTHDMASYLMMVLSFVAIVGVYMLGHVLIGDKLYGKSAWWGTMIFVAPAMFLLIAPMFDPSLQIGHLLNLPALNHPFRIALLSYIGISFFFQWQAKYGGCEVVTIPNFIFKKNYGSYCVPLLPLDMLEKLVVEKVGEARSSGV